jgi:Flp pilus assembly protein TadG
MSRSERGAALMELALTLPLLIVLLVGVFDFARTFYMASLLTNAARAGAQYGTQVAFSAAGVKAQAEAASPQISPYTVDTPVQACFCTTDTGASTSHSCDTACSLASEHLTTFVTVTTRKTFDTVMRFPGIPSSLTVERSVTMRSK